jgi:DNA invertase Pin-like site-specific DNA recombinase
MDSSASLSASLIGYARVSTAEQSMGLQTDALERAGCLRVFTDTASGAVAERPQLSAALDYVRAGDTLVVWRLDRLGRSIRHLIDTIVTLQERGVGFRSIQESIDTTTPGGRLVFHVFCALAEFERDLVKERTHAGLAAARARGRVGGRKPVLSPKQVQLARQMYLAGDRTVSDIATVLGVSRATIYRHLSPGSTAS